MRAKEADPLLVPSRLSLLSILPLHDLSASLILVASMLRIAPVQCKNRCLVVLEKLSKIDFCNGSSIPG